MIASGSLEIRPLVEADLDDATALHIRAFGDKHNDAAEIRALLAALLDRNRAFFGEHVGLCLAGSANGRLVAQVMATPTRLLFRDEPITGAATTLLAGDPDFTNPLLVRRLLRTLFAAPTDLKYADRINDLGRRAAAAAGMRFHHQFALRWARTLQPASAVASALANRRSGSRVEQRSLAAIGSGLDATFGRLASSFVAVPPVPANLQVEPLSDQDIHDHSGRILAEFELRPDHGDLAWIGSTNRWVESLRPEGSHHRLGVRSGQDLIGWFWLHRWPSGTGEAVQLVTSSKRARHVVVAMLEAARQLDITSLHGNTHPAFQVALSDAGALFHGRSAGCGIHADDPGIREAFATSSAYLTGLEGEYPLQLPRHR